MNHVVHGNTNVAASPSTPEPNLVGGSFPFKIVTMSTPTGYNIYVTGFQSGMYDNQMFNIQNKDFATNGNVTQQLRVKDKDIWLLSMDDNLNLNYNVSFKKSSVNYPSSIDYNETGPYSARSISTSAVGAVTTATAHLKESENKDERGFDMEVTQDGNLIIVGLVNFIGVYTHLEGNHSKIIEDGGGLHDPHRAGTTYDFYDEYTDGDAYLLKIDPATGSLIWAKNVSHFSSKDFYPQVFQNCDGNYIVAGSSADYTPTGYAEPESYDALVLKTPDAANTSSSPDHIWRKGFHAEGAEENMCLFGLNPTADGGFVVCGDNSPYVGSPQDNFSVSKLNPNPYEDNEFQLADPVNGTPYDINFSRTWGPGTFPNNAKIARRIDVKSGATLTINNLNLHFASSDQLADYWEFLPGTSDFQCGIKVEPGGQLVLNNTTLDGIPTCHPFGITDNRQMWDGVMIIGNPSATQIAANQGSLIMNNSTIKDARIGTSVDLAYRVTQNANSPVAPAHPDNIGITYSSRYLSNGGFGGGMVNANTSTWQDNRFGVVYFDYTGTPSGAGYYGDNTFQQSSLGMADPVFYARELDGGRGGCVSMLAVYNVDGVQVKDNNFLGDPAFPRAYRGFGVIGHTGSIDISAASTRNEFKNLGFAINYNFGPFGAAALNIANNYFEDNSIAIGVSGGASNTTIYQNDFRIPQIPQIGGPTAPYYPGIGIDLAGCNGYSVTENKFNYCPPCSNGGFVPQGDIGIVVNNAHDNDDLISANTFDALDFAAIAHQRNGNDIINLTGSPWTGLQWKCNDFKSNDMFAISRISLDINNWATAPSTPATMRELQGDCGGSYSDMTNNRFFSPCAGASPQRLYADGSVTQTVDYSYYNDLTYPEHDPGASCVSTTYNPLGCSPIAGATYDFSTACVPAPPQLRPADIIPMLASTSEKEAHKNAKRTGVESISAQQYQLISGLARAYGLIGEYDSAAKMLESYQLYGTALPFYAQAGRWADARRVWGLLPKNTTAEQQYSWLSDKAISLHSIGQTWKDIGSEDRALLSALAGTQIPSPAIYMARGVMAMLDMEYKFQWPIPLTPTVGTQVGNKSPLALQKAGKVITTDFTLYPNPTDGTFNVQAMFDGTLTIFNVQGMKMMEYKINGGQTSLTLPRSITPGVYVGQYRSADGKTQRITRIVYQP